MFLIKVLIIEWPIPAANPLPIITSAFCLVGTQGLARYFATIVDTPAILASKPKLLPTLFKPWLI